MLFKIGLTPWSKFPKFLPKFSFKVSEKSCTFAADFGNLYFCMYMKPVIKEATIHCYELDLTDVYSHPYDDREKEFIDNLPPETTITKDGKTFLRRDLYFKRYDHVGNKTYELNSELNYLERKTWQYEYFPDGVTIRKVQAYDYLGMSETEYNEQRMMTRQNSYLLPEDGSEPELVRIARLEVIHSNKRGKPTVAYLWTDMDGPGTKHRPYIEKIIRRYYNKKGQVTRELEYAPQSECADIVYDPMVVRQWTYDKQGRVCKYMCKEQQYDEYCTGYRSFTYNEDGTIRTCTQQGNAFRGRYGVSHFEYDQYGNWITRSIYDEENNELKEFYKRTITYYDK